MTMRTLGSYVLGAICLAFLTLTATIASAQVKPRSASGKDAATKKVALVVGVQDYDVQRLKLANARNDATEIAKGLGDIGFKVHLITDPTRADLGAKLAAFEADLDQSDIGLFYYSGHGMQTVRTGAVEASNLLLPRDFRIPTVFGREREIQLEQSTVALEDVIKRLREKSRVGIVFLDACRDNPFAAEEIQAAQVAAASGAPRRVSLGRGLSSRTGDPGDFTTSRTPAAAAAVKDNRARGMVIAYATSPGATADDGAGEHSPFTTALLKHMKQKNRSLEQMLRDVATEVDAATAGEQKPWVNASLLGGDLYLAAPGDVVPPGTGSPMFIPPVTRPMAPGYTPVQPPRQAGSQQAPVHRAAPAARPAGGGGAARYGGGGGGGRSSLPPGVGIGVGGGL